MKRFNPITMLAVLAVLFTNVLQAQNTKEALNQVELMKQFVGTWRNDTNKDSVYTAEFKPYGNGGLEFSLKGVTQGTVWLDMKELWGYDKKSDKVIVAGLMKDSPDIMLQASWFETKSKFKQVPFEFATDPKKADFVVIFDLKSPDLVVREEIVNNKSLGTETYNRIKN